MDRYEVGLKKLYGDHRLTISKTQIESDAYLVGIHNFPKATISLSHTESGRQHIVVASSDGTRLLETTAASNSASRKLQPLAGLKGTLSVEDKGDYYELRFKAPYSRPRNIHHIPRIILDTETTGLDPMSDEIIQVAIIDGDGKTLLNQLYKPQTVRSWPEAQAVHGISPERVAWEPPISRDLGRIQALLDQADEICVYNAPFDLSFFGELGLRLAKSRVTDTMRMYGQIFHGTDYYKLVQAAKEQHYRYHAHDALADCQATLRVQKAVDFKFKEVVWKANPVGSAKSMIDDVKRNLAQKPVKPKLTWKERLASAKFKWIMFGVSVFFLIGSFSTPEAWAVTVPLIGFTGWVFWHQYQLGKDGDKEADDKRS